MTRLPALFLLILILEVYLIVEFGALFGALAVFFELIASAYLGLYLMRSSALNASEAAQSERPNEILLGSLARSFAGLLLVIPGMLSDLLGLLLTINVVQKWMLANAKGLMLNSMKVYPSATYYYQSEVYDGHQSGRTFDGEYADEDDPRVQIDSGSDPSAKKNINNP
ncbi:MAG: FxsA family protein [Kangiellaceae bacterium]|jgi:UPF0716 protein FxsA|nr:FxsA family protein [Kangiellaceae bacterium]